MNLLVILSIVFVALTAADIFYFYLGSRGILDKIKATKHGKRIHDTIHNRVKHHVRKHSFFAVLGIKMLYGIAIIGIVYLGQKMSMKKFVFYDIIVNLSLCVIIYFFVAFFGTKLDNVLSNVGHLQSQILLIVIALVFLSFIQRVLAKRGIKLF